MAKVIKFENDNVKERFHKRLDEINGLKSESERRYQMAIDLIDLDEFDIVLSKNEKSMYVSEKK